ncbi:hypothetical protein [Microbacterium invictum]|uniref:Lipoprotein n=1 Tax=Microbacterium invictum TaxID=515415 RepID=A0AA40SQ15_9MICO|nr:hypothetical protein [Microbacterium invictum]MBB4140300.1 hypothetical protein [Microbacterium invictum]
MTRRRIALASAALVAFALALTGCATNAAPAGVLAGEVDVDAAWLDGGRMIALVTWGSSTCVPVATDVTVGVDGGLDVALEDPETDACTADLALRVTPVGVPESIDIAQELDIRVTYEVDGWGETDLDAYDGGTVEPYTPSAAAIDDDVIAILTWGSSSCAPVVASAEFDGETTLVVFETPASDQVCTMDMAPRVTLASAFNADEAATVTLSGGSDFTDPVTIPLVG